MQQIGYLYDTSTDLELIIGRHSLITYPLHNHASTFILNIVADGTITVTMGQQKYRYQKGELFICSPLSPHALHADAPYSLVSLCINKQSVYTLPLTILKNNVQHFLAPILPQLFCQSLLTALSRIQHYPPPAFLDDKPLTKLTEAACSLSDMARAAHMSKYHFLRCFKQTFGLTPHQFLLQNRVRQAQKLLPQTDNIAEVALITGFYDQSHLCRHFKKIIGLTPAVYKRTYGIMPSLL